MGGLCLRIADYSALPNLNIIEGESGRAFRMYIKIEFRMH